MKSEPKNQQKWVSFKCPHCGAEYLPTEIFVPGELLGRTRTVVRDALGKILYVEWEDGEEPTLTETYECDSCGKEFIVEATLSFKTKAQAEELDFSDTSVSLLDD